MKYNNQDIIESRDTIIGFEACGGLHFRDYQIRVLDILKEIDRICRKHGIQYYVGYGTLIGAIRHRGFIPWDDDADVLMHRDQLNRFYEVCKKELSPQYDFVHYLEKDGCCFTFSRIRERNSTDITRPEIIKHGRNAGIFVDLYVYDYYSDNAIVSFIQRRSFLAMHRLLCPGYSQGKLHLSFVEDFMVSLSKLCIGKIRSIKNCEKILGGVRESKASNVLIGCFWWRNRYPFQIFEKKHFLSSIQIPFEDIMVYSPHDPITFINRCYNQKAIEDNIFLESPYDDEYKAIMSGNVYKLCDVMFIPAFRPQRHVVTIFHKDVESSYFDSVYLKEIDVRRNNLAAIKERKFNERRDKYLFILNENERIIKNTCTHMLYKMLLNEVTDLNSMPDEDRYILSTQIQTQRIYLLDNLSVDEYLFGIKLLIYGGFLADAKRTVLKCESIHSQSSNMEFEHTKQLLDELINAYYAIIKNERLYIQELTEKYKEESAPVFSILKAVVFFWDKKYDISRELFDQINELLDGSFFCCYFLGEIAYQNNQYDEALSYYKDAVDTTLFMPFIQMALDRIFEVQDEQDIKMEEVQDINAG